MTSASHSEIQPETQSQTNSVTNPAAQVGNEALLAALLTATGIYPLNDIGWVRITGEDRVRWLNGMVTNSIQDLQPGQGNYNFILSAQGRIQGDAYVFAEPETLLLESASRQISNLIALLDRFIIMDDVELADISSTYVGLLVAGPTASALLSQLDISTGLAPLERKAIPWRSEEITILHAHSPLVPRFEFWSSPAAITALESALREAGAVVVPELAIDQLRLLEGTPRYGIDIRDKELPQETALNGTQSRALHFAKGCYLGQEIVERIRSRGNVHRTFTAFRLEGALSAAGTFLEADGKQVGEITSAAAIPLSGGPVQLALGYIRREAFDRNLTLVYSGGVAVPIASPFQASSSLLTPHGI